MEVEVKLTEAKALDFKFTDINEEDIWRLFVDGEKQTEHKHMVRFINNDGTLHDPEHKDCKDWLGYEAREKGCLQTMNDAFFFALSQKELTAESCKKIHAKAASHFAGEYEKDVNEFNTRATYSVSPHSNLSLEGLFELNSPPYNKWNRLTWINAYQSFCVNCYQSEAQDIESEIQLYKESQDKAKKENNKQAQLKNIIRLASSYARLHPGADGNNRTAVILLNSELIKHDFPPAILEDPNRIEGFSQEELYHQVCAGMANFKHVIEQRCYPGGLTNDQILTFDDYQSYFKDHPELQSGPPIVLTTEQQQLLSSSKSEAVNQQEAKKPIVYGYASNKDTEQENMHVNQKQKKPKKPKV